MCQGDIHQPRGRGFTPRLVLTDAGLPMKTERLKIQSEPHDIASVDTFQRRDCGGTNSS